MGAAQSRPVVVRCDNTLSRLPPHLFIVRMKPFCERLELICSDYLGRGLDPIVFHAIVAYKKKHRELARNGKEILKELVEDVTIWLEGFIEHVRGLRFIIGRMEMTAKNTGPASFLEQLSANPICVHILSQMRCSTMIVGGAMTTLKEVIGQECWRNGKLNNFFGSLESYLIRTFNEFKVVSTSQIELEAQLLDLKMQIMEDPDFGKKELSPVEMVIKEVLLDIRLEKL